MRILVLGGTQFVGHAIVADALARGWDVTVANRGVTGEPIEGTRSVVLDRTEPRAFDVLAGESFDLVADTWSGAPRVVRDAAVALSDAAARWVYVSSRSVYAWPIPPGADESTPLTEGDPDAHLTDYAADKRGSEIALERALGADRVVHLRAGVILGPRENVGRLPWWLRRIARGGDVLAPGPHDLGIQYIDARDLAHVGLEAAAQGRSGPVDVVTPVGMVTMGDLLRACVDVTGSAARLVWLDPEFVVAQGLEPWTELPVWVPRDDVEMGALHSGDVTRALEWGMTCRPLIETVADTWSWVQRVDTDGVAPEQRPGMGVDSQKEVAVLAAWAARQSGRE